ncbi:nuclear transport factor 2 family protein [Streptomyces sp. NPDC002588]|uniref:nuclear transport factor 2 family protein n=1 Tax=Streptomyces sp. NPDC002588 TaxID=3154419 RepID=UPI0033278382
MTLGLTIPERLAAIEEIKVLKARYLRFVDTKDWEAFRRLVTDDMKFYFESEPTPRATTGEQFVNEFVRARMSHSLSIHHGLMPEIEIIDSDSATGIWALYDWVDDPKHRRAFEGYGHYEEKYRRNSAGRWQISEIRLTRLRVELRTPSDLASVNRTSPPPADESDSNQ